MTITFYKYQGTGNDFVMIDNRHQKFDKNNIKLISHLCNRRFGIGADGLILLENHKSFDFKMVYFNADGNESSMCGNGGRCITAFAKYLGIIQNEASFEAIDGLHHSIIDEGVVRLQMQNVTKIQDQKDHMFLNTGSPHHVQIEKSLDDIDVRTKGSAIRYSSKYKNDGCNINFVTRINADEFEVRTYERGVEDETLSCGTGVTAVALAMHYIGETDKNLVTLRTQGGNLQVAFKKDADGYKDIWLIGPAKLVFKGEISW